MAITPHTPAPQKKEGVPVKSLTSARDVQATEAVLARYLLPYEIEDIVAGRELSAMSAGALMHLRHEAREIGNKRMEEEARFRAREEDEQDRQRGAAPQDRGDHWLR